MDFALAYLGVMLATAVLDVCWTMILIETEKRHALKAAFWSTLIILSNALVITSYVHNKWLISAAVIGAFIGTYGTIKFKVWKDKQQIHKSTKK